MGCISCGPFHHYTIPSRTAGSEADSVHYDHMPDMSDFLRPRLLHPQKGDVRMHGRLWRRMLRIAVVVVTLLVAGVCLAEADVLFGATGSRGVRGELVLLNTTNGAPLVIGRLIDGFGRPYGITGLAFQPGTNVLFGSTAGVSPTAPG